MPIKEFKQLIGSRAQVMHGTAKKTGGGLHKKDLMYNAQGKIVSKRASKSAKKSNNLVNAGYVTQKGVFGAVNTQKGGKVKKSKKGRAMQKGGEFTDVKFIYTPTIVNNSGNQIPIVINLDSIDIDYSRKLYFGQISFENKGINTADFGIQAEDNKGTKIISKISGYGMKNDEKGNLLSSQREKHSERKRRLPFSSFFKKREGMKNELKSENKIVSLFLEDDGNKSSGWLVLLCKEKANSNNEFDQNYNTMEVYAVRINSEEPRWDILLKKFTKTITTTDFFQKRNIKDKILLKDLNDSVKKNKSIAIKIFPYFIERIYDEIRYSESKLNEFFKNSTTNKFYKNKPSIKISSLNDGITRLNNLKDKLDKLEKLDVDSLFDNKKTIIDIMSIMIYVINENTFYLENFMLIYLEKFLTLLFVENSPFSNQERIDELEKYPALLKNYLPQTQTQTRNVF